jgi:hypothetical protein
MKGSLGLNIGSLNSSPIYKAMYTFCFSFLSTMLAQLHFIQTSRLTLLGVHSCPVTLSNVPESDEVCGNYLGQKCLLPPRMPADVYFHFYDWSSKHVLSLSQPPTSRTFFYFPILQARSQHSIHLQTVLVDSRGAGEGLSARLLRK